MLVGSLMKASSTDGVFRCCLLWRFSLVFRMIEVRFEGLGLKIAMAAVAVCSVYN